MKYIVLTLSILFASQLQASENVLCFDRDYTIAGKSPQGAKIQVFSDIYSRANDGADLNSITYDVLTAQAFKPDSLANTTRTSTSRIQKIRLALRTENQKLATATITATLNPSLEDESQTYYGIYSCQNFVEYVICNDSKGSGSQIKIQESNSGYDIQIKHSTHFTLYDWVGMESSSIEEFINQNGEFVILDTDIYNLKLTQCSEAD